MIGRLLAEADKLAGGRCTVDELELMSRMVLQTFRHRSVESLVVALRDGMMRTDDAGKIYGKVTWATVNVWLADHEAAILRIAEGEHAAKVVKNDNLGGDYMDRMERDATAKDRTIASQGRLIEQLRLKLDANE